MRCEAALRTSRFEGAVFSGAEPFARRQPLAARFAFARSTRGERHRAPKICTN